MLVSVRKKKKTNVLGFFKKVFLNLKTYVGNKEENKLRVIMLPYKAAVTILQWSFFPDFFPMCLG